MEIKRNLEHVFSEDDRGKKL